MSGDRTRFFRSIRFRLSAWYALILFILIVLLGAGVSSFLERELRRDVDARLESTAEEMLELSRVAVNFGGTQVLVPPPRSFSFPSQLIQVVNAQGEVQLSTENLGGRRLPIVGEPGTIKPRFDTAELDGVTIRALTYPIQLSDGRTVGAVNVAQPLIQLNETLDELRRQFLLAALAGAALAAVAGWFLAGRALKPVDTMVATARGIAAQSSEKVMLSERLAVPGTRDELARLASTFNDLLNRIQQAFDAQRQFVADASHELRTPLTAIRGNVDLLDRQLVRDDLAGADASQTLADLQRESARMSRLIDDLLTLARSESPGGLALDCEPVNLAEIADDAARTALAAGAGPSISIEAPEGLGVMGDRDRLEQVMIILLENAIRHTPADGAIWLRLTAVNGSARIIVQDTGSGIEPDDLPRVFDRFYRADESRQRSRGGTGLGLAIARAIVVAHAGTIRADSAPNRGTTFTITIPQAGGCKER